MCAHILPGIIDFHTHFVGWLELILIRLLHIKCGDNL